MHKSDFNYRLPNELIAQHPVKNRIESRLLVVVGQTGALEDREFADFPALLSAGDLLVFNDTRVIPARLLGRKDSGGKVEVLVERVLDGQCVVAQLRTSKTPKTGRRLILEDGIEAELIGRHGDLFELHFLVDEPVTELLDRIGRVPLPPYIERPEENGDRDRYQTVYARQPGAVAAPTAGLHFDETMLKGFANAGIDSTFITLHVGAGTFQPLRSELISEHHMHSEYLELGAVTCEKIAHTRTKGGRVIAVGTTVVRALETAADESGRVSPYRGETDIFIYPGFRFRVVDAMLTNFHLPESTLLMLVCGFAGREHIFNAYRHAIRERYRFFSYGDAMFLTPKVASGK